MDGHEFVQNPKSDGKWPEVTKFVDGGYTVGVSMSHAAADAQSFYDFVRCWGETCRKVAMTVPPCHMRSALSVNALLPTDEFTEEEANGCLKSEYAKGASDGCLKEEANGCLKSESIKEVANGCIKMEAANGCHKLECTRKEEANGCLPSESAKEEEAKGRLPSESSKEAANGHTNGGHANGQSESPKEEANGRTNGGHANGQQKEKIALSTHDSLQLDELLSTLMASKELQNGDIVLDELVKELQNGNVKDDLVKKLQQMRLGLVGKNGNGVVRQNGNAPSRAQAPVMEKQLEEEEHRRPRSDLVQKIFSFSTETLKQLKEKANAGMPSNGGFKNEAPNGYVNGLETLPNGSAKGNPHGVESPPHAFTTFEAFCAHWWQCLIGARCLPPAQPVFLLIPINCRQRFLDLPKGYFGNALDGGLVRLTAGELCAAEPCVIAGKIHQAIMAATEQGFTQYIKEAEKRRNAIPHFDRTGLFHIVDSPKYPVYDTDFGFGPPEAVRAEGFRFGAEVQILAGRLGPGSYDLFCALDTDTMDRLENSPAFLA